jgi:hypothetical protein
MEDVVENIHLDASRGRSEVDRAGDIAALSLRTGRGMGPPRPQKTKRGKSDSLTPSLVNPQVKC